MTDSYVAQLLLVLAVILIAAKLAAHVAKRAGQPPVLGELVAGIVLGNLTLAGIDAFEPWKTDASVAIFAQLGVVLIVFQVGVESTVREMLRVGVRAAFVAALGVTGSFAFGTAAATWLLPSASTFAHVFLGGTLCATSVGISARVLKDLHKGQTAEARVILGAAVVDDVLGLIILAMMSAIATRGAGAVDTLQVAGIVIKAATFLVGALAAGVALSGRVFRLVARLDASEALIAAALGLCFLFAWIASFMGLAPIIGAFAAGLVLEEAHSRPFVARGERSLDDALNVLTALVGPVFFVLTGARTSLAAFADIHVVALAAVLTTAAIGGKLLCALGVAGKPVNRLAVAAGMIPRGEVQLIFASLGATLLVAGRPLVEPDVFSAIIIVVVATTLVTPPALKWSFARKTRAPR